MNHVIQQPGKFEKVSANCLKTTGSSYQQGSAYIERHRHK